MKTKNLLIASMSFFMTLLSLYHAKADQVTVDFHGTFGFYDETGFMAGAGVNNGDPLSGSFTYETTASANASHLGAENKNDYTWADYNPISFNFNINNKVSFTTLNATVEMMNSSASQAYSGWYFNTDFSGNLINLTTGAPLYIWGVNFTEITNLSDVVTLGLSTNLPSATLLTQAIADAEAGNGYYFFRISSGTSSNNPTQYAFDGLDSNSHWTVQAVPEPSTYALLGIGSVVMLILLRKKRSA